MTKSFSFEACFTLASGVVNGPVRLRYHIEAEPGRKVSRVKFAGSLHTDTPHVLDREVTLRHRSRHCSRELAYLKEKSDIQHPVAMMLSYSLLQKEPRMPLDGEPLPDLGRFPILNRREALRRFEAKFLKDCGSDEICESNLHLRAELDLPSFVLYGTWLMGKERRLEPFDCGSEGEWKDDGLKGSKFQNKNVFSELSERLPWRTDNTEAV
ncbi:ITGA7 [Cordylochernes scorpioides]|uniref:ITGA7 n=1 Tax=Cordylochernes scorpioides TaxID=51811 RepID=A0ABY6L765_9ARAC|nr:ITGA7 [Cordylochernes scorpioides]